MSARPQSIQPNVTSIGKRFAEHCARQVLWPFRVRVADADGHWYHTPEHYQRDLLDAVAWLEAHGLVIYHTRHSRLFTLAQQPRERPLTEIIEKPLNPFAERRLGPPITGRADDPATVARVGEMLGQLGYRVEAKALAVCANAWSADLAQVATFRARLTSVRQGLSTLVDAVGTDDEPGR